MKTKELIKEATSLPVNDRALLVDSLLRSLNSPQAKTDKEWVILAKKRLEELRSGAVKPIPGDEVFKNIFKNTSR